MLIELQVIEVLFFVIYLQFLPCLRGGAVGGGVLCLLGWTGVSALECITQFIVHADAFAMLLYRFGTRLYADTPV